MLQDVHWSAGLIGYFPTYTLGNLRAAQLFAQAEDELGGLAGAVRPGRISPRSWRGCATRSTATASAIWSPDLIAQVTGQPLSHEPLIRYLRAKLGPLYHLDRPGLARPALRLVDLTEPPAFTRRPYVPCRDLPSVPTAV